MNPESSWGQRIGKVMQYLRRGNLSGLVNEVRQFLIWKRTGGHSLEVSRVQPETGIEFLLPQIRKHVTLEEFPFIAANKENPDWSEEKLRATIHKLGPWEYFFAFSHRLTTKTHATFSERTVDFHRFRSKIISETIVELLGDELGQSTVLDLACHNGVFALDMAFRGARLAHGIEIRERNLNKARFLKNYYRITNVTFERGNVYRLARDMKADVVMCLGILYHITQPVELVEFCYHNSNKLAVIDTICHKEPISAYHVIYGKNPKITIEGTRSIELHPTYRAVIDTMRAVGFKEIMEVVGTCDTPIDLYSDYTRRCFIGFK